LFDGVHLGDHDQAEQRLRSLFSRVPKKSQRHVARAVFEHVMATPKRGDEVHISTSFLEAIARLDAALVPIESVEQLVLSQVVEHRMSAAMMLWDLAEVAPGVVPIDLVAKLAKPATEDWYVFAPALGAVKQLALSRRSALQVLLDLAESQNADDRLAAVEALAEITRVNATLIPIQPVRQLCSDADQSVSEAARKLRPVINKVPKRDRETGYRTFGL